MLEACETLATLCKSAFAALDPEARDAEARAGIAVLRHNRVDDVAGTFSGPSCASVGPDEVVWV